MLQDFVNSLPSFKKASENADKAIDTTVVILGMVILIFLSIFIAYKIAKLISQKKIYIFLITIISVFVIFLLNLLITSLFDRKIIGVSLAIILSIYLIYRLYK